MVMSKDEFIEKLDLNGATGDMIVTSGFLTTLQFALARSFISIYAWIVLIAQLSYYFDHGVFFTYFTHWSFMLLTAYLSIVTYLSWMYHLKGKEFAETNIILGNAHHSFKIWVLFEVVASAAFGLDVIYWVALYNGQNSGWTNFHVHGVNAFFVLVDLFSNRLKFNRYHFFFFLPYLLIYLIFMWIYYGASGDWVYSVLDFTKAAAAIWYPASLIVFILAFGLVALLIHARQKLILKVNPTSPDVFDSTAV